MGYEAAIWIPHFPLPSPVLWMQMYPLSPQVFPHEFLTLKYFLSPRLPYPTARTPWSSLVPQFPLQTPLLQSWKERWLASMATETGVLAMAPKRLFSLSTVTSVQSLTVQTLSAAVYLQLEATPLQGYLSSVVIPLSLMQKKERFMRPPPHPLFPQEWEQSTSCCSEKDLREFWERKQAPSTDPVVEKAQQDPHCPWFLTGVTAFLVVQSTSSGRLLVGACCPVHLVVTPFSGKLMRYLAPNSAESRSANSFISTLQVSSPASYFSLWALTKARLLSQTPNLYASSLAVYLLLYLSFQASKAWFSRSWLELSQEQRVTAATAMSVKRRTSVFPMVRIIIRLIQRCELKIQGYQYTLRGGRISSLGQRLGTAGVRTAWGGGTLFGQFFGFEVGFAQPYFGQCEFSLDFKEIFLDFLVFQFTFTFLIGNFLQLLDVVLQKFVFLGQSTHFLVQFCLTQAVVLVDLSRETVQFLAFLLDSPFSFAKLLPISICLFQFLLKVRYDILLGFDLFFKQFVLFFIFYLLYEPYFHAFFFLIAKDGDFLLQFHVFVYAFLQLFLQFSLVFLLLLEKNLLLASHLFMIRLCLLRVVSFPCEGLYEILISETRKFLLIL